MGKDRRGWVGVGTLFVVRYSIEREKKQRAKVRTKEETCKRKVQETGLYPFFFYLYSPIVCYYYLLFPAVSLFFSRHPHHRASGLGWCCMSWSDSRIVLAGDDDVACQIHILHGTQHTQLRIRLRMSVMAGCLEVPFCEKGCIYKAPTTPISTSPFSSSLDLTLACIK